MMTAHRPEAGLSEVCVTEPCYERGMCKNLAKSSGCRMALLLVSPPVSCLVEGSGVGSWEFEVKGLKSGVLGLGFAVWGSVLRFEVLGFRV